MAWLPISNTIIQYVDANGDPYSGAVLKFYEAGTSTNIPVATSSSGTPTATSVALNSDGFPEVSSNVVALFIDQDFKIALYPNQAAADSNTGAVWTVDNIDPFAGYALPANLAAINALTPTDSVVIVGNGTTWVGESGNTARISLGLGSTNTPIFDNVQLSGLTTGHVVLANSAGGLTALDLTAKGSLIAGDGAGAPVAVAAGTNDYVLTADSAQAAGVKWAALPVSSSAVVLVAGPLTPTVSANIDFLTAFSADYDAYLIVADGLIPSAGDYLELRLANSGTADSGSNYFAGAAGNLTAGTKISITADITLSTGIGAGFSAFISNCNAAGMKRGASDSVTNNNASPQYIAPLGQQFVYKGAAVSGFRLYWSTGSNFTAAGSVSVYGYKNS